MLESENLNKSNLVTEIGEMDIIIQNISDILDDRNRYNQTLSIFLLAGIPPEIQMLYFGCAVVFNFLTIFMAMKKLKTKLSFKVYVQHMCCLHLVFSSVHLARLCVSLTGSCQIELQSTEFHIYVWITILLAYLLIFQLTFLSIDRWVAVTLKLRYRKMTTPRMAGMVVCVLWGVSVTATVCTVMHGFIPYSSVLLGAVILLLGMITVLATVLVLRSIQGKYSFTDLHFCAFLTSGISTVFNVQNIVVCCSCPKDRQDILCRQMVTDNMPREDTDMRSYHLNLTHDKSPDGTQFLTAAPQNRSDATEPFSEHYSNDRALQDPGNHFTGDKGINGDVHSKVAPRSMPGGLTYSEFQTKQTETLPVQNLQSHVSVIHSADQSHVSHTVDQNHVSHSVDQSHMSHSVDQSPVSHSVNQPENDSSIGVSSFQTYGGFIAKTGPSYLMSHDLDNLTMGQNRYDLLGIEKHASSLGASSNTKNFNSDQSDNVVSSSNCEDKLLDYNDRGYRFSLKDPNCSLTASCFSFLSDIFLRRSTEILAAIHYSKDELPDSKIGLKYGQCSYQQSSDGETRCIKDLSRVKHINQSIFAISYNQRRSDELMTLVGKQSSGDKTRLTESSASWPVTCISRRVQLITIMMALWHCLSTLPFGFYFLFTGIRASQTDADASVGCQWLDHFLLLLIIFLSVSVFLNPLIYCWRVMRYSGQRKICFYKQAKVHPSNGKHVSA